MKKIFVFVFCVVAVAVFAATFAATIEPPLSSSGTDKPKIDISSSSGADKPANSGTDKPETDISSSKANNPISMGTEKHINVPTICQYPELPTGCESVAATMVLQYYGEDISPDEFAFSWLEYSEDFYTSDGNLYGPDPNKVFAGNPFTEYSYGCFAAPIVNAINRNSTNCTARIITDCSLEDLCSEYINNDKPLLIWATMNMKEASVGRSWYLSDGSKFTWTAGEHCLVLVGYNEYCYFLNDHMSGGTVAYPKGIVEKRFKELNEQVVYISPN